MRRYVVDLLTALIPLVKDQPDRWEIDLRMAQFKHVSLLEAAADLLDDRTPETNVPLLLLRS